MEALLATFATQLDQHLETFFVYLAKRHRLNPAQLKADFKLFQQGKLEVLEGEPLKTASKINSVTKKDEIKQVVKDADSDAEESLHLNEDSNSLDAPKPVDSDDEEVEVAKGKGKVSNPLGKASKPVDSDDSSEDKPVDDSDESSAPPPKAKPVKGKPAAKKPVAKDDSDSESEPKPVKGKGKAKVVDPESDDDEPTAKPKAKGKATKVVEDKPGELSATPKMTDGPKVPKDVKFVKGTNLAVVDGVVVAAYTKKGFVALNKTHDKQIEKTGLESDAWDKDKVAKKLNK